MILTETETYSLLFKNLNNSTNILTSFSIIKLYILRFLNLFILKATDSKSFFYVEPGWNQVGTGPEPGWNQAGTRLEPGWNRAGTRLEPGWNRAGTRLEPGRSQAGTGQP